MGSTPSPIFERGYRFSRPPSVGRKLLLLAVWWLPDRLGCGEDCVFVGAGLAGKSAPTGRAAAGAQPRWQAAGDGRLYRPGTFDGFLASSPRSQNSQEDGVMPFSLARLFNWYRAKRSSDSGLGWAPARGFALSWPPPATHWRRNPMVNCLSAADGSVRLWMLPRSGSLALLCGETLLELDRGRLEQNAGCWLQGLHAWLIGRGAAAGAPFPTIKLRPGMNLPSRYPATVNE